jgi:predicted metal-binding protein
VPRRRSIHHAAPGSLEHFPEKWTPVFREQCDQPKKLTTPSGAVWVTSLDQINGIGTRASSDAAIIYVCITCRHSGESEGEPLPGAALATATATAAQGTGISVREVRCLANCTRGPSAAIRCNGSWTYVFGGLDIDCAGALVEGARLLARAADGLMPWRGRPAPLKRGLIARVPPLDFQEMNVAEDVG